MSFLDNPLFDYARHHDGCAVLAPGDRFADCDCGYDEAILKPAPAPTVDAAALREAVNFRASVTFDNLDPQPSGPDLLIAIAAYMDRQDDAYEIRTGEKADRTVQADVRRWADDLRAVLRASAPGDEG